MPFTFREGFHILYEKALEIALAMEAAVKDTKDLLAASNQSRSQLICSGRAKNLN